MTQENCHAAGHEKRQEPIELNGQEVWADPEMIPLLKMLNEVGLTTRSHCSGHVDNPAWVVIRLDNVEGVEVRTRGDYQEVVLTWQPPEGFARPRDKRYERAAGHHRMGAPWSEHRKEGQEV